ncbi:ComF family protein [Isoptericola sp. b490]|uniref:ComF family protein n=1 Tax=Actinotalea lenta TaxID=3064654 RepID=UPI00271226AC|nr:ComF family protein [Isoptericola sp. b490]MDO8120001.1 ComF family protein [Isoptericola sp. b490]
MRTRLLQEVLGLVLPVCCAGCGTAEVPWCEGCAEHLRVVGRREDALPRLARAEGSPPLPVWTAGSYAGPVRRAVPAWKDGGRADLTDVMVAAVRSAAAQAAEALAAVEHLRVVPVPSRAAAVRRRGMDLVGALAAGVCAELGAAPRAAVSRAVGRYGGRDQVGLGARARGRNATAFRLRHADADVPHLLVDDVVTTGATLAACEDVLARAGVLVVGAVAVAATPGITRPALHPGQEQD